MAHQNDKFESLIFTPLDWQLLRKCPCPVWMVKDKVWPEQGSVVVGVNLSNEESYHDALNLKLVSLTQDLAKRIVKDPQSIWSVLIRWRLSISLSNYRILTRILTITRCAASISSP